MGITKKQKEAAKYLIQGVSKTETAKLVGCDPSTLRRWLHQDSFIRYSNSLTDNVVETDFKTFAITKLDIHDCLEEIRQTALNRLLQLLCHPDDASRNEINLLKLAGKWSGLESINDRVDMQLDYLQRRMPPEAYDELLKALATSGSKEIASANTAGC